MDNASFILLIILGTLLIAVLIYVPIWIWAVKTMRRHVIYEHYGHKIEIFTYMFSAKLVIDGQIVDSGTRVGQNYNYQFLHKLGDDVIKVFINMKVWSPEIKLYINDERQNINY